MAHIHPIHPLDATRKLGEDYARYLKTIYFFRDEDLRQQFQHSLESQDFLVKGPILEAAPPFRIGRSIRQLVENGVLHHDFERLCSSALPYERPLYLHQDEAIAKVATKDRNVVVATGTGSGKTEAFLIPIFNYLLQQREAGILQQPGVRALLLYPMNALANDQLKRLRGQLAGFPDITFGRYTGETKEDQKDAEEQFRQQFGDDPLPNERISRVAMRSSPPHILITNYAMLEYLLLRPRDSEFFDGDMGRFWRFIVLDEAHIYDGASGIEIAMLLRRVKDRVVRSEPGRLRCIATSATLGRGPQDFPAVANFAHEIFGETFEWIEDDSGRQDVVEGRREEMSYLAAPWGKGSSVLYSTLTAAVAEGRPLDTLAESALGAGVPHEVIQDALVGAAQNRGDTAAETNAFLYGILRGDQHLHELRSALGQPQMLRELVERLGAAGPEVEQIISLVDLAVRARPDPDTVSLLPARYHVFARALEGAFVCLNREDPKHAIEGQPRFFLKRFEACPHCGKRVFELAACPRCGTAYIVGQEMSSLLEGGTGANVLRQPTASNDDPLAALAYFVLGGEALQPDEDEAVVTETEVDLLKPERLKTQRLCLGCGSVSSEVKGDRGCNCSPVTPMITVQRIDMDEPTGAAAARGVRREAGILNYCVRCGARSANGVVYRFLTGQDAPVSVLATSLYQLLPADRDERAATLPGQGRKLLIFADSRQDAAFFAPYLERTYRQLLRRRLILRTLVEDSIGRLGRLGLEDLTGRVVRAAESATLFDKGQRYDERVRLAGQWLAQEFINFDYRIGLEGLGLLHFRLVEPDGWEPPAPLLVPPWSLSRSEAWDLLVVLLNSLRQQGAVTFPPNVDPRDEAFAPRNKELFVKDTANDKLGVFGWAPKRGSSGSNRRMDFLIRLLVRRNGWSRERAKPVAYDTLLGLWHYLTDLNSCWRDHLLLETRPQAGSVWRVNHRYWDWAPAQETDQPVYRCSRCFNVSYVNLASVCPMNGCDGELQEIPGEAEVWKDNHYRHIYRTLETIPLSAEEHTAQWKPDEAGKVQDRFIRGEINVLSCSTTFELGVDVGDLQAVLMRNVPPTTANYIQRAGRAGRRSDSVAFVLTYAQRRSHDLSHFNTPEKMVSGRILPPVVTISNEKIVRRHVHSVFVAAFLRWAKDEHGREYGRSNPKAGQFFAPSDGKPSGPDLLAEYLHRSPENLQEALRRIVPKDLQTVLEIERWGWLPQLTNGDRTGILDRAWQEVTDDLAKYEELEQEAARNRRYDQAKHFERVAWTVRDRDLLGFLGSRNVLPAYGFPSDVVELRTGYVPSIPEASKIELQRDLKIAISEYAPGGQVMAAKRTWTSGGLYLMPGHDLRSFYYAVCPSCGRFHRAIGQLDSRCTVPDCDGDLFGGWPQRNGRFVIPEFGFVAARKSNSASEKRPHRLYASRAFFAEYAPQDAGKATALKPVPELSGSFVWTFQRYSRYGTMAVVNGGFGKGFRICFSCGWAEPATPGSVNGRPQRESAHQNPRTGRDCSGRIETRHLGHEFITDVLEIRFSGARAYGGDRNLWLSVLYALLEGASATLGIPRDDLDGTLYPFQGGEPPALVLFDNVPGGAGHVRRVSDALAEVVHTAHERVAGCECGEETSCYECLRNFYNQWCHDQLTRGAAMRFLNLLLTQKR